MSFQNAIMAELSIPRSEAARGRLVSFYQAIGWKLHQDGEDPYLWYVRPPAIGSKAVIAYWLTENQEKIQQFADDTSARPSIYAYGARLAVRSSVELSFVLENDGQVLATLLEGGEVLQAHVHTGPRVHCGALEFRFTDPFNYSMRVTSDPGYQMPN